MAFGHDLGVSLLIGSEVFAVAALWPLSTWAMPAHRRGWFVAALAVIVACLLLEAPGLLRPFDPDGPHPRLTRLAGALGWAIMPLFIMLPDAVCIAFAHALANAGVPARRARTVSLAVSGLTALAAPLAGVVTGCRLSGACF